MKKQWPHVLQGVVAIGFCIYFATHSASEFSLSHIVMLTIAVVAIIATTILASRSSSSSHSSPHKTLNNINREKNLQYQIEVEDANEQQLADDINELVTNVRRILGEANLNIEQLFENSAKLSASSAEIANASDTQNELANQINHSIHNLSLGISNVTQHATNTMAITHETFELCKEGENDVQEVTQGVNSVNDTFQSIGTLIQSLAQRSEEIAGIINVIGEIADQTNLLALNAAIEAARAGEQGRGFAVVADEVRSLAERTRSATVQVTDMVTAICNETKQVVDQMDAGTQTVNRCVDLTEKTSEALASILAKAADVEARTNEIASSAEEQNYASTEIETTVNQITDMSTNINQNIHQSNEEMRSLLRMAADMVINLREYKTAPANELTDIRDCITLIRMNAILVANASSAHETNKPINDINTLDSKVQSLWYAYQSSIQESEEKNLANSFDSQWKTFLEARAITLSRGSEGNFSAARHNASTNAGPKFQQAKLALEELIRYHHP